jgi:Zn-dependent M16 (insulinase) family peptidase
MRSLLLNRKHMIVNITIDQNAWAPVRDQMEGFLEKFPSQAAQNSTTWQPEAGPQSEALIAPSQVNFVGKAFNLYQSGYQYHGSINVIAGLMRTMYLWEKVRVQGGAYGAFCGFDRLNGAFWFGSYRDPNLLDTLKVFDRTADWLSSMRIDPQELERSIIGTIGEIDSYMLPDMLGYVSLQRHLIGVTDVMRARTRAEVLATTQEDLHTAAQAFTSLPDSPLIKVLAGPDAAAAAGAGKEGFLTPVQILDTQ